MQEIRTLVFTSIRDDTIFKTLTGATASDPRIFWQYTPQKVTLNNSKPGYVVYYRSGTVRTGNMINIAGREDQIYTVEIWGKTPAVCDDIADRLVDKFRDTQYSTTSYSILHAYGNVVGSPQFHDGRKLYTLTVNLFFTKIVQTVGVS